LQLGALPIPLADAFDSLLLYELLLIQPLLGTPSKPRISPDGIAGPRVR
jgi:hypothetical protein